VLRIIDELGLVSSEAKVAKALTSADWAMPLVLEIREHVMLTIDLPEIDTEIPQFEEYT
jgi:hypothetical protein